VGFVQNSGIVATSPIHFSNEALFNTDAMSADEITSCLKRARKAERQVQGKYPLSRVFAFVALHTGKKLVLRNAHLNALGYLFSFSGSRFVFSLFVRIARPIVINLFPVTKHCPM